MAPPKTQRFNRSLTLLQLIKKPKIIQRIPKTIKNGLVKDHPSGTPPERVALIVNIPITT